jgi:methylation protein EvaC
VTDKDSAAPAACRVCGGVLAEFLDLGDQPLSQRFREPGDTSAEYFFRLAVGQCATCTMVQRLEEIPPEVQFPEDYVFTSSSSSSVIEYFAGVADGLLATELTGDDPFFVEVGCNDGVMLRNFRDAGVRHLGFEASAQVAALAAAKDVRVRAEFFGPEQGKAVAVAEGYADVIYSANTINCLPDLSPIFLGIDELLAPDGVFVFEDTYFGDIVEATSFDQIYDEHYYLFSARSVRAAANRYGFDLVDARRIPVRGGQMRFTLAREGARRPTPELVALLAEEDERDLTGTATLHAFAERVARIRTDLVGRLTELKAQGRRVVGYGATAKSVTLLQYCGIGPDLLEFVSDTTPAKQGKLTPGQHIPIRSRSAFADDYPDYALLFAWDHAEVIIAKEQEFAERGGRWLLYVPDVHEV